MGEVWQARHLTLGFDAAVKVLSGGAMGSARDAIANEIHALALLDHPHIARIRDRGVVDESSAFRSFGALAVDSPWFAIDWVGAGTLHEHRADLDGAGLLRILHEIPESGKPLKR